MSTDIRRHSEGDPLPSKPRRFANPDFNYMPPTRPLTSRVFDIAHKSTVYALIGSTMYLGYKIFETISRHKRTMKEAAELAQINALDPGSQHQ